MAAASRFTNPATGTVYRLVDEAVGWRITKSMHDDGQLRLAHLRGQSGAGSVDAEAVARLVAGHGGVAARATDPAAMFAAVVLCDLEGTANVLTAIAREAASVCEAGCRGFRPRSPVLRRQRDDAMARAVSECRIMAESWRASGLTAARLDGCRGLGWAHMGRVPIVSKLELHAQSGPTLSCFARDSGSMTPHDWGVIYLEG